MIKIAKDSFTVPIEQEDFEQLLQEASTIKKEVKKVAFDISTTSTGAVIQSGTDVPIDDYKLFIAKHKDPVVRIRTIITDIFDWLEEKEFNVLIISKATHQTVQESILLMEGVVLGEAIRRKITYDYYPDSAWYSKMGDHGDMRPIKKARSVRRFIERNNLHSQIDWIENRGGSTRVDKIIIHLKDGTHITDDIADAFNAADLYEKRMIDYKIKTMQTRFQRTINALLSKNKQINKKIKLVEYKIKAKEQEKKELEKLEGKRAANSVQNRQEHINTLRGQINELNDTKTANLRTIERYRRFKNGKSRNTSKD
jgi:hypothetical protein